MNVRGPVVLRTVSSNSPCIHSTTGSQLEKSATRTHLQLTASIETVQGVAGAPGGDAEFAGVVPAATCSGSPATRASAGCCSVPIRP